MVLPATGLEIILSIPIERKIVLKTNLKEERSGGHHAATTAGIRYYLLRICTATGHSTILCPDSSHYQDGVPAPKLARSGGKGSVYEKGAVSAGGIWAGRNVVSEGVGRRTNPTYSRKGAGEPVGSK